ncbi:GNAT family N-acetyltransferase [Ihubacter massiliensis]|uniref:GNAT family N-acetyltransferase n=1 Tax=Hominibacterium faecale TaxID=2839743 RepID=A0A9J6QV59_9FIRM|nr:GNAT family N-acetyltransferase [Hominibacterium faecale]MCO7123975.1 GNAT family N-acetyltransferase [Ihubacter massiliensis]MCU7378967.1 GNAT family N-acetyltransferase [Hominibacterium faecale]
MEIVEIKERTPLLLLQLLELWEKSVRATHLFLSDEEIGAIKGAVPAALKGIPHLIVAENEKIPAAFMGIDGQKLEMLFVSAEERGKGIGKKLLEYGIEKFAIRELAVNEDNPLAKEFYEHMGFEVFKRTDHDEQGNPYPLLYMKLHTCKGVMDHENAGKKY